MVDATKSMTERRRHARTHLHMLVRAIRLEPDGGDVVDDLRMQDISKSGIGALSDRAYYPGQRIIVCLPLSTNKGRRTIYATIRRCRQVEDGYSLGMEFDSVSIGSWCGTDGSRAAA